MALLTACEGAPARSKPWRNVDTQAETKPSAAVSGRAGAEVAKTEASESRRALRVAVPELPDPQRLLHAELLKGAVFEPILPRLAKSVTPSADGLLLTIELHADISAHDGKSLSAADVRASLDAARRRGGPFATDLRDIAAIEVPSPRLVRLRLRRANGYIRRMLRAVPVGRPRSRAGTGPFKLEEIGDEAIVLQPFANFTGQVPAAPVELIRVADPAAAIAQIQIGDVDVAIDRRQNRTPLTGVVTHRLEPARFQYLVFNAKRSLFADTEVRRAASLVVDRKRVAHDGHRGRAVARQHPIWPAGPIAAPAHEVRAADKSAGFELLDRAGWMRTPSGARERDKQKLIATAVTVDADDPTVAIAFEQLRTSGFVLDVRELDRKDLEAALRSGDFDIAVLEWAGYSDWDLSPLFESRGPLNHGRIESSVLQAAVAKMRIAQDASGRRAASAGLGAALEEVVPIVTLVSPLEDVILSKRVSGISNQKSRLDLVRLRLD